MYYWFLVFTQPLGLPDSSVVTNLPANAGDAGLIPGLGRSPGVGNSNPLQYSCLENPMDRGAWWATVHRVTKSQTWLKRLSTHAHFNRKAINDWIINLIICLLSFPNSLYFQCCMHHHPSEDKVSSSSLVLWRKNQPASLATKKSGRLKELDIRYTNRS